MDPQKPARDALVYYFRLPAEKAGLRWDTDNDAEVREIVDPMLKAAERNTLETVQKSIVEHNDLRHAGWRMASQF